MLWTSQSGAFYLGSQETPAGGLSHWPPARLFDADDSPVNAGLTSRLSYERDRIWAKRPQISAQALKAVFSGSSAHLV